MHVRQTVPVQALLQGTCAKHVTTFIVPFKSEVCSDLSLKQANHLHVHSHNLVILQLLKEFKILLEV